MTIIFSQKARLQIEENVRFIAADKPNAARKWAAGVKQAVYKLKEFPYLGRQVPEYANDTLRELIYGEYRIVSLVAALLCNTFIRSWN